MDPNANLAEQRRLVRLILDEESSGHSGHRLAELVEALDEWMTKGGFSPSAWVKTAP